MFAEAACVPGPFSLPHCPSLAVSWGPKQFGLILHPSSQTPWLPCGLWLACSQLSAWQSVSSLGQGSAAKQLLCNCLGVLVVTKWNRGKVTYRGYSSALLRWIQMSPQAGLLLLPGDSVCLGKAQLEPAVCCLPLAEVL